MKGDRLSKLQVPGVVAAARQGPEICTLQVAARNLRYITTI